MDREEAIRTVRLCCPKISNSECDFETAMRVLIPELRESEDEKIRKGLIEVVSDIAGGWPFEEHRITKKEALAYLEKQKEQTWIPTDEQRTALGMVLKHSDPDADSTKVLESLLDELTKIANPKVAKWKEKQKEQKPLSPDEKMNHSLYLEGFDVGREVGKVEAEQKPEDRFEEAREKYQVEWSEEDEEMIKMILGDLEWERRNTTVDKDIRHYDKEIAFLKSLRPSWKPSEEQMSILKAVKEHVGRGSGYWGEGLGSLIKDLEKLI